MEDEILEQIKQLFRESQDAVYGNGAFDAMADQAEATGDVVPAVAQLVASVISSVVKDAGVRDVSVLLGLGIMLIADMLDGLQKVGIEAPADVMNSIINEAMKQVLANNPDLAEEIASDPAMQQAMQNPEGFMNEAMGPEQAPAPEQGVLAGVGG